MSDDAPIPRSANVMTEMILGHDALIAQLKVDPEKTLKPVLPIALHALLDQIMTKRSSLNA